MKKITHPSACRQSLGTLYLWSDRVFSPTIHKSDDTSAGILAHGVNEESPVLGYFELFLLSDMMNIVTSKFHTYIMSKTPSTAASHVSQWKNTLCIVCNTYAYSLSEKFNNSRMLVDKSPS
jgi:hypothetical protein